MAVFRAIRRNGADEQLQSGVFVRPDELAFNPAHKLQRDGFHRPDAHAGGDVAAERWRGAKVFPVASESAVSLKIYGNTEL